MSRSLDPGRRRWRRWPAAAAVGALALCLSVPSACSGNGNGRASSSTTVPAGRPINDEEASRLADVLVRNREAGGAELEATIPFGSTTFRLSGRIDWQGGAGRVTVRTERQAGAGTSVSPDTPGPVAPFDVVWNSRVVFEQVPGLEAALAAQGRPGVQWVARPLDPTSSPLHTVLQLILSSSSIQRDNPVLLRSKGVTRVRADQVQGTPVEVFDYGRTSYWVGDDDGRTHRIDAALAKTGSTAQIVFAGFGAGAVPVPAEASIAGIDEVGDVYRRLTGG